MRDIIQPEPSVALHRLPAWTVGRTLVEVRPRHRTVSLFAGPQVEGEGENPSAIVFRSENDAFSHTLVFEAGP